MENKKSEAPEQKELWRVFSGRSRAEGLKKLEGKEREMQHPPKTPSSHDDPREEARDGALKQLEEGGSHLDGKLLSRPVTFSAEQLKALVDSGLIRGPSGNHAEPVRHERDSKTPTLRSAKSNSRLPVPVTSLRGHEQNSRAPGTSTGKDSISQTFPPTREKYREPCGFERMVSASTAITGRPSATAIPPHQGVVQKDTSSMIPSEAGAHPRSQSQHSLVPENLIKSTARSTTLSSPSSSSLPHSHSHSGSRPHTPLPSTDKQQIITTQRSIDSLSTPRENRNYTSMLRAVQAAKMRREHDTQSQSFPATGGQAKRMMKCKKPGLPDAARGSKSLMSMPMLDEGMESGNRIGNGNRLPIPEVWRGAEGAGEKGARRMAHVCQSSGMVGRARGLEGAHATSLPDLKTSTQPETKDRADADVEPREDPERVQETCVLQESTPGSSHPRQSLIEMEQRPASQPHAHTGAKERSIVNLPPSIEQQDLQHNGPTPPDPTTKPTAIQVPQDTRAIFSPRVVRFTSPPQRSRLFSDWTQREEMPLSAEKAANEPEERRPMTGFMRSKYARNASSETIVSDAAPVQVADTVEIHHRASQTEEMAAVKHDAESSRTGIEEVASSRVGVHGPPKTRLARSKLATAEDAPDESESSHPPSNKGKEAVRESLRGHPEPSAPAEDASPRITEAAHIPTGTGTIAPAPARDDPIGFKKWLTRAAKGLAPHDPNNDSYGKGAIGSYIPTGAPNTQRHARRKVHFADDDTHTVQVQSPTGASATKTATLGVVVPRFQYLPNSKHGFDLVSRSSPAAAVLRGQAPSSDPPQRPSIRDIATPRIMADLISPEVRTLMDKVDKDNNRLRAEGILHQKATGSSASIETLLNESRPQDKIERECAARMEQINREAEIKERAAIAAQRQREEEEHARAIWEREESDRQRREARIQRRRQRRQKASEERKDGDVSIRVERRRIRVKVHREVENALSLSPSSIREGVGSSRRERRRSEIEMEEEDAMRRSIINPLPSPFQGSRGVVVEQQDNSPRRSLSASTTFLTGNSVTSTATTHEVIAGKSGTTDVPRIRVQPPSLHLSTPRSSSSNVSKVFESSISRVSFSPISDENEWSISFSSPSSSSSESESDSDPKTNAEEPSRQNPSHPYKTSSKSNPSPKSARKRTPSTQLSVSNPETRVDSASGSPPLATKKIRRKELPPSSPFLLANSLSSSLLRPLPEYVPPPRQPVGDPAVLTSVPTVTTTSLPFPSSHGHRRTARFQSENTKSAPSLSRLFKRGRSDKESLLPAASAASSTINLLHIPTSPSPSPSSAPNPNPNLALHTNQSNRTLPISGSTFELLNPQPIPTATPPASASTSTSTSKIQFTLPFLSNSSDTNLSRPRNIPRSPPPPPSAFGLNASVAAEIEAGLGRGRLRSGSRSGSKSRPKSRGKKGEGSSKKGKAEGKGKAWLQNLSSRLMGAGAGMGVGIGMGMGMGMRSRVAVMDEHPDEGVRSYVHAYVDGSENRLQGHGHGVPQPARADSVSVSSRRRKILGGDEPVVALPSRRSSDRVEGEVGDEKRGGQDEEKQEMEKKQEKETNDDNHKEAHDSEDGDEDEDEEPEVRFNRLRKPQKVRPRLGPRMTLD